MRRTALAVLGAVAAALAVAGAAVAASTDSSTHVGQNVFANPPAPLDANNSPSIARNPRRPENVVISHRVDLLGFSAAVQWSMDGGRAYRTTVLPLPAGLDRPFAPDVAFAPDGTLYVSYVNLQGAGNRPHNLWVARSTDGGRTLSEPVRVAGDLSFQARIAVDERGVVHLTWLKVADVAPYAIVGDPSPVVASRSSDGGRSWSEPVQVSDPERRRVGAASPVVDADGDLVVLYQDFKGDARDFQNLDGPVWEEPFALVVTVSRDGGRTFSPGVEVDDDVVPTRRFLVFLPEFPSLASGPDGALYVAWGDGRHGDLDVFLRRSDDGGRTWARPVRVNDNRRRDGTSQYLPRVDVAPGGRVDVVFLDRRRDPGDIMTDAFLAVSDDGGRSFENLRISSSAFDARVGFSANPKVEPDLGSRLGLSSLDDETLAAWPDTRLGTEETARQDIAAVKVRLASGADGLARVPVIALLLALGAACLLGWWLTGRSPRSPTATEPSPRGRPAAESEEP